MKYWQIIKDDDNKEFEVIGKSNDDYELHVELADIKDSTRRNVRYELMDVSKIPSKVELIQKFIMWSGYKYNDNLYKELLNRLAAAKDYDER